MNMKNNCWDGLSDKRIQLIKEGRRMLWRCKSSSIDKQVVDELIHSISIMKSKANMLGIFIEDLMTSKDILHSVTDSEITRITKSYLDGMINIILAENAYITKKAEFGIDRLYAMYKFNKGDIRRFEKVDVLVELLINNNKTDVVFREIFETVFITKLSSDDITVWPIQLNELVAKLVTEICVQYREVNFSKSGSTQCIPNTDLWADRIARQITYNKDQMNMLKRYMGSREYYDKVEKLITMH